MTAKVETGSVVSLDPASPGRLALSAQAYDRRVAGIVSGAMSTITRTSSEGSTLRFSQRAINQVRDAGGPGQLGDHGRDKAQVALGR